MTNQNHNITERKQAEESLRETEETFRTLAEQSPNMIFINKRGRVVYANKRCEDLMGYTRDEFYSPDFDFFSLIAPEYIDLVKAAFSKHMKGEEVEPYEFALIIKAGKRIEAILSTKIIDYKGECAILGIITGITERKRAEEALKESEERYRGLYESSIDGIFSSDIEGKIVECNQAYADMLNYTKEELYQLTFWDYTPRKWHEMATKIITEQVIPRGYSDEFEIEVIKKDGTIIPISIRVWLIKDKEGTPTGMWAIIRDITESKRAEEQILRQSAVLDGINRVFRETLTCETDDDVAHTCLAVAEKLTGSKFGFVGELSQLGLFDTIAISNPGWDACKMPGSEATRLIVNMETRGIDRTVLREEKSRIVNDPASHPDRVGTPESHPPITSFLGVPLKHAGRTIGMIGLANKETGYDLADQQVVESLSVAFVEALYRKRAEGMLSAEKERLAVTLRSIGDGVITTDIEGKVVLINKVAENLTGWTQEEAIGKPLDVIFHIINEKTRERCEGPVEKVLKTGAIVGLANDTVLVARDGTERFLADSGAPIRDKSGNIIGVVLVFRDITERKKAEMALKNYTEHLEEMVEQRTKELRDAQEELIRKEKLAILGQLAGGVGHELRNPLGAIKNAAYFLNMVLEDSDPDVKETLGILEKEVNTSEKIISSLLDFARTKPLTRRNVDINNVVQDALSSIIVPENVEVINQLDEALPTIFADSDQLGQVFGNIILNAIQAMPEGGRLTVTSEVPSPEWITISFADTGGGIPEENLRKVFEPLFTTKAKGIGLGLAVTKTLVDAHKGTIKVKSEVGKGSTFTIRLPLSGKEEK